MIRRSLGLLMIRALARLAWRLLRVTVFVAALVLAAPVAAVAAYAAALAWFLGWPPRQLYRAAAWCRPMIAAWLAALAAGGQPWPRLAAAPYLAWLAMWHEAAAGSYLKAVVTVAPLAIPLGLVAGGLAWSWRIYSMETGSGGLAPSAPAAFDQRQWRHQVRTARARIAAPGSVPLLLRDGSVVAGATIRTVRQPARPLAVIPYPRLRSHQVVLGTTGTGKTTLLLRLWAGFMTRGMQVHAAGRGPRPLLVVLDCKGGADSRRIADRARRVLRAAGAASTAIWPDEASLSLWALPPRNSSARWRTWSSRVRAARPTTPTCWRRSSGWRWRPPAGRRPARPTSSGGWTRTGWPWPTRARRTTGPPGCCVPRPGTSATWRCGTARCCAGWAPGSTGRAGSVTRTPGTASWRGRPRSRWPRRRPARWSTCSPGSRPAVPPAARSARSPRGGSPPGHPPRGGRVQRRLTPPAHLATLRAGPLARPGCPGVGPVLAGAGRRRR